MRFLRTIATACLVCTAAPGESTAQRTGADEVRQARASELAAPNPSDRGLPRVGVTADPAVGQKRDPKFARKLLEATSAIRTSGAPGVLVRVKRGGQTYELALGLASISEKRPATTATVWRIASVTKLIVAHLALDLSSRGLLRIERPLSETMSGLPPLLARIPVRNLLDHSSRVPEYLDQDVFGNTALSMFGLTRSEADPEVLFLKALQRRWFIDPLAQHQYANTNYVLVQHAIEAATGKSLADVLKARLLTPLGLLSTGFVTPAGDMPDNHLKGYVRGDTKWGSFTDKARLLDVTRHRFFTGGDGGIWTSLSDLSRILDHVWRTQSAKATSFPLGTMTEKLKSDHDGFYRYGLGVMVIKTRCRRLIYGHDGLDLGTVTHAFANADNSRQLLLAANLSLDNNVALTNALQRLRNIVFCT